MAEMNSGTLGLRTALLVSSLYMASLGSSVSLLPFPTSLTHIQVN